MTRRSPRQGLPPGARYLPTSSAPLIVRDPDGRAFRLSTISSRRRPVSRRKHSAKSISGLATQHFAAESDHHGPRYHAAVPEGGGEPRNVGAALDRDEWNVDRP